MEHRITAVFDNRDQAEYARKELLLALAFTPQATREAMFGAVPPTLADGAARYSHRYAPRKTLKRRKTSVGIGTVSSHTIEIGRLPS